MKKFKGNGIEMIKSERIDELGKIVDIIDWKKGLMKNKKSIGNR